MDIFDAWSSVESNFLWNSYSASSASPGAWNDPDMLEVGVGYLTHEEQKTHFALWSISKAPLILGMDLENADQKSIETVKNEEIIAINQDPNSSQATCTQGCSWFSSFFRYP